LLQIELDENPGAPTGEGWLKDQSIHSGWLWSTKCHICVKDIPSLHQTMMSHQILQSWLLQLACETIMLECCMPTHKLCTNLVQHVNRIAPTSQVYHNMDTQLFDWVFPWIIANKNKHWRPALALPSTVQGKLPLADSNKVTGMGLTWESSILLNANWGAQSRQVVQCQDHACRVGCKPQWLYTGCSFLLLCQVVLPHSSRSYLDHK